MTSLLAPGRTVMIATLLSCPALAFAQVVPKTTLPGDNGRGQPTTTTIEQTTDKVTLDTRPAPGLPPVLPGSAKSARNGKKAPAADVAATNVSIVTNNNVRTIRCNGNTVRVMGNNNSLVLKGICKALIIQGNNNSVTAATLQSLTTPGNHNSVTWTGEAPKTSNLGTDNSLNGK